MYLSLSRNFYLLLSILKLFCFIFLPWLGQSWGNDQKLGIWKSISSIWCSCLLIWAISYFLEVTTYNQTTTLGEWYQPSAWWKLILIIANNFAVCLLLLYYQNSDRNAELFFIYFFRRYCPGQVQWLMVGQFMVTKYSVRKCTLDL